MNVADRTMEQVALACQDLSRARWRFGQALVAAVDIGGVKLQELAYALNAGSVEDVERLVSMTRERLAREAGDHENDERRRRRERRSGLDRRQADGA